MTDRHSYFTMVKNFGGTRTKRKRKLWVLFLYQITLTNYLSSHSSNTSVSMKPLLLFQVVCILNILNLLWLWHLLPNFNSYISLLLLDYWTSTFCKTVAIFSIFGVTLTVHDTKKTPNFPNLFCHHTIEGFI